MAAVIRLMAFYLLKAFNPLMSLNSLMAPYPLTVLLSCLSLSGVAAADVVKSYTLKTIPVCQKNTQLMVFSAEDFPYLMGQPVKKLAFFSVLQRPENTATQADKQWQPVVFQIDQKDKHRRFILPPEQAPAALSKQDELVIRKKDLGAKLHPDSEILNQYTLIEVKVLSDSLAEPGWFYINVMPLKRAKHYSLQKKYLSYNKAQDIISSADFKIGFSRSKPFLIDTFQWHLDNNQWSSDLSDMMKIRHKGHFLGLPFRRTQDDYSSVLSAVKQGPLRVIRRTENRIKVFWKLKTPKLYIDYIMTPDGFSMDTMVDIPFKISFFFSELETLTTMDWNPDQSGKLLVSNAQLARPIVINGKDSVLKQMFNNIEDNRFRVETFKGNLEVELQVPDNFPVHAMLYLKDNPDAVDPPENYPGQTGNVGFRTIGWEDIDSHLYHLKFTVCIAEKD